MREIKFRIWKEDFGAYMKQYQGSEPIGLYTVGVLNTLAANGYDKSFEFEQYTGLKDTGGVEIYEGDIVEITDCAAWDEEAVVLDTVVFESGNYSSKVQQRPLSEFFYIKVAGNIHEHPELREFPLLNLSK